MPSAGRDFGKQIRSSGPAFALGPTYKPPDRAQALLALAPEVAIGFSLLTITLGSPQLRALQDDPAHGFDTREAGFVSSEQVEGNRRSRAAEQLNDRGRILSSLRAQGTDAPSHRKHRGSADCYNKRVTFF